MKARFVSVWGFMLVLGCLARGSAPVLSPLSSVSLLTYEPLEDLYTAFGHSAVRVKDPALGLDVLYNYGTFEFEIPAFYVEFTLGKLNYMLSTKSFAYFRQENYYFDRGVSEQVLSLSLEQRQAIFDFLENNYLPENRYYLYDFFYDNCATRIRDAFEVVLGDSLVVDSSFASGGMTFRQLLDLYLVNRPWSDFGIDLALGAVVDKPAGARYQMFLPDYLAKMVGSARLRSDGAERPLVAFSQAIYRGFNRNEVAARWYLSPLWLFGLLAAIVSVWTVRSFRRPFGFVGDRILFAISGLAGWLLVFLWFGTQHTATAENWNIVWLNPLHLAVPVLLGWRKAWWLLRYYLMGVVLLTILLLACWTLVPQEYNLAFLPLVLIFGIRAAALWKRLAS